MKLRHTPLLAVLASAVSACVAEPAEDTEDTEDLEQTEQALVSREREIEYYNNAAHDTLVGYRYYGCSGNTFWGVTSLYREVYDGETCGGGSSGGGGNIGCYVSGGWCAPEFSSCIWC